MKPTKRKILITNALTYANDDIHLGHMVGYVLTDIWTRFQKIRGHECLFLCGSDCHGTPIMLRAEREKISPDELVTRVQTQQAKDCQNFLIDIDNFYTTHSEENRELAEMFYHRLAAHGDIIKKEIQQAYDPVKKIFLPDRYIKGTCPRCGAQDQYGDNCEQCGATYASTDLKDPISVISGATPVTKTSEHYFFALPKYTEILKKWIHKEHLQPQTIHKLDEWFTQGLQDWDISRDAPYFGFEIPNAPGKYFYVWLDAPMGYIAAFKNLAAKRPDLDFDEYWGKDSTIELHHFIGKDIMYFHTLFWPAILISANLRTPSNIAIHGFLTIDGQKMSKSRGTFIKALTYLQYLDPEYLRYYFASKLSSHIEDIDLNLDDFRLKVNADLIGKVVNIASRCAGFIHKHFHDTLSDTCPNETLLNGFIQAEEKIAQCYEQRELSQAVREIMTLADRANQYIDQEKPWLVIKNAHEKQKTQEICSLGINLFRILVIYLKPILPLLAKKTEAFLNVPELSWEDIHKPLWHHQIKTFQPMMQRIEETQIEQLRATGKSS